MWSNKPIGRTVLFMDDLTTGCFGFMGFSGWIVPKIFRMGNWVRNVLTRWDWMVYGGCFYREMVMKMKINSTDFDLLMANTKQLLDDLGDEISKLTNEKNFLFNGMIPYMKEISRLGDQIRELTNKKHENALVYDEMSRKLEAMINGETDE